MNDAAEARYDALARGLHWLLALALVATFGVGLYMVGLPLSPTKARLYNGHKWAGVAILTLSALRLGWRLARPPPPLPPRIADAMPPWQAATQRGTHTAMYLMFFVVPLLGWAYSSSLGFPVVWFGVLPLPDWVPENRELARIVLKPLHAVSAWILATLVALHVGAVFKHQLIDRDGLLARMRGSPKPGKQR
jgi:cytochrome b561